MKSVAINGARVWGVGIALSGIVHGVWSYMEKGDERGFLTGTAIKAGARGFCVGCVKAVIIPPTVLKRECENIWQDAKSKSRGF